MSRFAINFVRAMLGAASAAFLFSASAAADDAQPPNAHPALWTVHGPKGTAYLLGSIHALPPNVRWKTPEIMQAIAKADTFVFEIPLDHQERDAVLIRDIQSKVQDQKGMLPPGQSLRAQLPENLIAKYDAALTAYAVSPGYVDRLQPWLAAEVLEDVQLLRTDMDATYGVDRQIYAIASAAHKTTRGLESVQDQLNVITPAEQRRGMEVLAEQITGAGSHQDEAKMETLIKAWSHRDLATLMHLGDDEFDQDPAFRAALLDNRNHRWVGELKQMLAENHTYFVTVGAAHLIGPNGVPSQMRKAGYRVDGPADPPPGPGLRLSRE